MSYNIVSKRQLFTLSILYFIVFLNSFGYFLIIPELAAMIGNPKESIISHALTLRWGDYLFSFVLGLGSLSSLLFAPILGRLSDFIGRKKVLIICTILTLVSFILPILALINVSFSLFMLGNFINGISSNNQPISQAVISDLSCQQNKKAWRFSVDTFVVTLAMTLGPIAGTFLADSHLTHYFNQTTPFMLASVLTALNLILLIIFLPETNQTMLKNKTFSFKNVCNSFTDILSLHSSLKRLFLVFFLVQMAWAQYFQYSYLYLTETLKFSAREMSLFNASVGFWISISLLLIYPYWLKKLSLQTGIKIAIFLSIIGMLALSFCTVNYLEWIFIIPTAFGIGLYFPSLLTLFSAQAGIAQGWMMAIANALIGLAWLLSGFSAVYLSALHRQLPILSAAGLLLISLLIMCYDTMKTKSARNTL